MEFMIGVLLLGLTLWAVFYLYRDVRARRTANDRLLAGLSNHPPPHDNAPAQLERPQQFARRHYFLPWVAAVAAFLLGRYAAGLPASFAGAFAFLVGLLLSQFDAMRLARVTDRIESQLADAIDLMVSSLKVGAALQTSLENALRDARQPLRPQLEEVLGRIRLGEPPRNALAALSERVPLETFHLFATALSVHWDVGGSLTQTLATVGRTIRNRIEISRRLRALTAQSRASIVAILLTTYFIAALMWRHDPKHMIEFLATEVGQWMVSVSIVLQGVGMVWISQIASPKF